jgi:hypothetical protein
MTEVEIFAIEVQTVVDDGHLTAAVLVGLCPGKTRFPHGHLLFVVRGGADPTPFVRRGADQLTEVYIFGNGKGVDQHGHQTAQRQDCGHSQYDPKNLHIKPPEDDGNQYSISLEKIQSLIEKTAIFVEMAGRVWYHQTKWAECA